MHRARVPALPNEAYFGAPVLAWRVEVPGSAGGRPLDASVTLDATDASVRTLDPLERSISAKGRGTRSYPPLNDPKDEKLFPVTELAPGTYAMLWPGDANTSVIDARVGTASPGDGKIQNAKTIQSRDLNSWDSIPAQTNGSGAAVDAYTNVHIVDQFFRGAGAPNARPAVASTKTAHSSASSLQRCTSRGM
jgi:hypothetical protein